MWWPLGLSGVGGAALKNETETRKVKFELETLTRNLKHPKPIPKGCELEP